MRYDSDHKQKTRDTILHEAAGIIRAVGPDKIGIKSIMAKAGLTHGGFYAHFANKDDLVAEAIAMMFEERRRAALDLLKDKNARDGLYAYIDMYLSDAHVRNLKGGCPLPALSADVARLPDAAKQKYAEGFEGLVQLFSERLDALGHRDPDALAHSILTEMIGAVALARTMPSGDKAHAILETSRHAVMGRI